MSYRFLVASTLLTHLTLHTDTLEGVITVSIEFTATAALFKVQDTGVGIDDEGKASCSTVLALTYVWAS
jgi:hypothetical protein